VRKQATQSAPVPPTITVTRILIASSDRNIHEPLQERLNDAYAVSVVHTAPQATDGLAHDKPHLLILDSDLEGTNGCELCQQIKNNEKLGFIPIILLLPPDTKDDDPCHDCGADMTLVKPIETYEILSWVRFLLRIKRQIDRLMHENQELAQASRGLELLKSDIISNVSHELSTPLVQVKAAVALLEEDTTQHGTREQKSMAAMATQAVARLESALENIRQLAQTHQIKLAPMSVSESADLAIRMIERSWASRGGRERIHKQMSPNLPLVLGDKRAMARLLQLLLDNALKFSPDDSPVYILSWMTEDDQVWIGVQDFGIGIAQEQHARIFEAFYQVDGSSTRRYGGTGAGLALALLLAQGMKTSIRVESEKDKGSIFSFSLPVTTLDDFAP
jgi:signal transduction histidine kinase